MLISRIFRRILPSPVPNRTELFDARWYAATYPEIRSVPDLWLHYLTIGAFEGRQPNPLFDSKWYLDKHPGLIAGKLNPLMHYILQGSLQGADPHPLFCSSWYLQKYPDVAEAHVNPLTHYLNYGANEGRSPSPFFDASWYREQYPEAALTDLNPLIHYLAHAREGSYNPNPYFNNDWYRDTYLASGHSDTNPLIHFIEFGEAAGHSPSQRFDEEWYRNQYADLTDYKGSLFRHFLEFGRYEGRYPAPGPTHFVSSNALDDYLSAIPPSFQPIQASAEMIVEEIPSWIANRIHSEAGRIVFACASSIVEAITKTDFPRPPYVALLRDVNVLAGTRYVFTRDNTILHDEERHFYHTEGAHLKYFNGKRTKNGNINVRFNLRAASWIECGIDVMHEYSNNYFHFIAETIPRIILVNEANLPPLVPFLFEDNLHRNIRDIISRIIGKSRPIIWLKPGMLFTVRDLYVPSDLTSVIDAYDGGPIARQSALDICRIRVGINKCKENVEFRKAPPRRKLFASRNGGMRKLLNQDMLEQHFSTLGFEILRTDNLSLEEQIRAFQEAEIIIGPTGAQMSNIIWCEPDTSVIVLASDHPSHQLYLWELLGKVSSVNVKIVVGPRAYTKDGKYSVHDDYTVAPDEVMACINTPSSITAKEYI